MENTPKPQIGSKEWQEQFAERHGITREQTQKVQAQAEAEKAAREMWRNAQYRDAADPPAGFFGDLRKRLKEQPDQPTFEFEKENEENER